MDGLKKSDQISNNSMQQAPTDQDILEKFKKHDDLQFFQDDLKDCHSAFDCLMKVAEKFAKINESAFIEGKPVDSVWTAHLEEGSPFMSVVLDLAGKYVLSFRHRTRDRIYALHALKNLFISHSGSQKSDYAAWIKRQLPDAFFDSLDIMLGSIPRDVIVFHCVTCLVFIPIISKEYLSSSWCMLELLLACARNRLKTSGEHTWPHRFYRLDSCFGILPDFYSFGKEKEEFCVLKLAVMPCKNFFSGVLHDEKLAPDHIFRVCDGAMQMIDKWTGLNRVILLCAFEELLTHSPTFLHLFSAWFVEFNEIHHPHLASSTPDSKTGVKSPSECSCGPFWVVFHPRDHLRLILECLELVRRAYVASEPAHRSLCVIFLTLAEKYLDYRASKIPGEKSIIELFINLCRKAREQLGEPISYDFWHSLVPVMLGIHFSNFPSLLISYESTSPLSIGGNNFLQDQVVYIPVSQPEMEQNSLNIQDVIQRSREWRWTNRVAGPEDEASVSSFDSSTESLKRGSSDILADPLMESPSLDSVLKVERSLPKQPYDVVYLPLSKLSGEYVFSLERDPLKNNLPNNDLKNSKGVNIGDGEEKNCSENCRKGEDIEQSLSRKVRGIFQVNDMFIQGFFWTDSSDEESSPQKPNLQDVNCGYISGYMRPFGEICHVVFTSTSLTMELDYTVAGELRLHTFQQDDQLFLQGANFDWRVSDQASDKNADYLRSGRMIAKRVNHICNDNLSMFSDINCLTAWFYDYGFHKEADRILKFSFFQPQCSKVSILPMIKNKDIQLSDLERIIRNLVFEAARMSSLDFRYSNIRTALLTVFRFEEGYVDRLNFLRKHAKKESPCDPTCDLQYSPFEILDAFSHIVDTTHSPSDSQTSSIAEHSVSNQTDNDSFRENLDPYREILRKNILLSFSEITSGRLVFHPMLFIPKSSVLLTLVKRNHHNVDPKNLMSSTNALDLFVAAFYGDMEYFRSNFSGAFAQSTRYSGPQAAATQYQVVHDNMAEGSDSSPHDSIREAWTNFLLIQASAFGVTPIHVLAYRGHVHILAPLLRALPHLVHGSRRAESVPPLTYAVIGGHTETVDLLLQYGPFIHSRHYPFGITALHWAVILNHWEIATRLISYGADPWLPAHFAICTAKWGRKRARSESLSPTNPALNSMVIETKEYLRKIKGSEKDAILYRSSARDFALDYGREVPQHASIKLGIVTSNQTRRNVIFVGSSTYLHILRRCDLESRLSRDEKRDSSGNLEMNLRISTIGPSSKSFVPEKFVDQVWVDSGGTIDHLVHGQGFVPALVAALNGHSLQLTSCISLADSQQFMDCIDSLRRKNDWEGLWNRFEKHDKGRVSHTLETLGGSLRMSTSSTKKFTDFAVAVDFPAACECDQGSKMIVADTNRSFNDRLSVGAAPSCFTVRNCRLVFVTKFYIESVRKQIACSMKPEREEKPVVVFYAGYDEFNKKLHGQLHAHVVICGPKAFLKLVESWGLDDFKLLVESKNWKDLCMHVKEKTGELSEKLWEPAEKTNEKEHLLTTGFIGTKFWVILSPPLNVMLLFMEKDKKSMKVFIFESKLSSGTLVRNVVRLGTLGCGIFCTSVLNSLNNASSSAAKLQAEVIDGVGNGIDAVKEACKSMIGSWRSFVGAEDLRIDQMILSCGPVDSIDKAGIDIKDLEIYNPDNNMNEVPN